MSLDALDVTSIYNDAGYPVGVRAEDRQRRAFGNPLFIAGSVSAVVAPNNTSENTLASFTIPGGLVTPGTLLELRTQLETVNNANTKTMRLRVNGTPFGSPNLASGASHRPRWEVWARPGQLIAHPSPVGEISSGAILTQALDLAVDIPCSLTMQLATGADAVTLNAWALLMWPNPAGF